MIVLLSVFNEADTLGRAIESVLPYATEVRVHDGAFAAFPHSSPSSTDGTQEVAARYPRTRFFPVQKPWGSQIEKRNAMFQDIPEGSLVLILDGDEWIQNPEEFEDLLRGDDRSWDVGWVEVMNSLYLAPYRQPRVLRFREGLHYAGRHYWIFDRERRLFASHQGVTDRYIHRELPLRLFNQRKAQKEPDKTRFRGARQGDEGRWNQEVDVYRLRDDEVQVPQDWIPGNIRPGTMRVLQAPQDPEFTLLLPVSRPWAIRPWFERFRHVRLPDRSRTEILAIMDSLDSAPLRVLEDNLREVAREFDGVRVYWTRKAPHREFDAIARRRERILEHWHVFQTEALGRMILGAEDDTLPDPDAYLRLLEDLDEHDAAFAQGTIVGRWGPRMVPHWRIEGSTPETITEIATPGGMDADVVPIQGGGWFCFVCPVQVFRSVRLRWTQEPPMGPDLWFVWSIVNELGLTAVGDWRVRCDHILQGQTLSLDDRAPLARVGWARSDLGWRRTPDQHFPALPVRGSRVPKLPRTVGDGLEVYRMKRVRVTRHYQDEGTMFFSGQVVEMSGWKAQQLANRKLVEILDDGAGGQEVPNERVLREEAKTPNLPEPNFRTPLPEEDEAAMRWSRTRPEQTATDPDNPGHAVPVSEQGVTFQRLQPTEVPEFTLTSDQPVDRPAETPEDRKDFEVQATREAFGSEVQDADTPITPEQTACHVCGREFDSPRGFRTHLRLKHGITPPIEDQED